MTQHLDDIVPAFAMRPTPTKDVSTRIKSGPIRLTASEAAEILERYSYPGQKRHLLSVGAIHCQSIADMMTGGHWREQDAIAFARLPNGDTFLINGHHRLTGQILARRSILWTFIIHHCRDMAEVQELYGTFDTNVRIRTHTQILDAVDFATQVGLQKMHAAALFQAVAMVTCDFNMERFQWSRNRIITERIELAHEWAPEARYYEWCTKNAPSKLGKKLWATGPLAVGLVTLRYQEEIAKKFWRDIGDNDGLRKNTPEHTFLRSIPGVPGNSSHPLTFLASRAWNARFRNESLGVIRTTYQGKQKPISILGTPWAKSDADVDNDDTVEE